jgi:putative hydrolase of the HAD superfamily
VLFDVSGTLLRLTPPAPLLRAALGRDGYAHPEARVVFALRTEIAYYLAHHHEAGDEEALRRLRLACATVLGSALGGHHPPVDRLARLLAESLRFELFADVGPALDGLSARGLRLGVVSNWDCGLADVLTELGIADHFAAIVPSAAVGIPKPSPEVFKEALRRLGVAAQHALYVGDRPEIDGAGASAAGIASIMIDRTGRGATPRPGWITSLSELLGITPDTVSRDDDDR